VPKLREIVLLRRFYTDGYKIELIERK